MRWREQRRSENVEDRRGGRGPAVAIGGGGLGLVLILVAVFLCGGDPGSLLRQSPSGQIQPTQQQQKANIGNEDQLKDFASAVLGSTEDVWNGVFAADGLRYRDPKLVIFSGRDVSACGYANAAMGPFYCPGDQKIYLDFSFFDQLQREFRAPGDFAAAYVIAHEVGHHVQNLLGTMDKVNSTQQRSSEEQANMLSVRLELQADCFAGIWAANAKQKGLLEEGDVEEAINAAAAVGDDMIQKRSQGYVVPESFTHGSARERVTWFTRGMNTGDVAQCNTFQR
ncbi:MAG: neutral zinc metallopeptidase [Pyrinomonadaceae bacterium]